MTTRPTAGDFFIHNIDTSPIEQSETSDISQESYDSLAEYFNNSDDSTFDSESLTVNNNCNDEYDSLSMPSLSDDVAAYSDSEDEDSVNNDPDNATCSHNSAPSWSTVHTVAHSLKSATTKSSNNSSGSDNMSMNRDTLPKSFLQLKGISVGNFNMGCNFRIDNAITIMIHYKLHILAIQEHTPWNRQLSTSEVNSIKRHCDSWGYIVTISPLQILIIDKQLAACHRETNYYEEGRIFKSRFEITKNHFVTFIPVYGVAHSGGENSQTSNITNSEENTTLEKMNKIQKTTTEILNEAKKNKDIIYVFGDLQDTPDNSKTFHFGSCRIPKHPLGIVQTCESAGLQCSIYQYVQTLEKPIISRIGSKGGRFIDGMYTCWQGLQKITGISIINDSGINSDHRLIVSKLDLGIEEFRVSKDKEERIDFKSIMSIPVHIKPGHDHPSLNETVFKGADFQLQAELYHKLQNIVNDSSNGYLTNINSIRDQLQTLEDAVILSTKELITPEDQITGKLIPRTPQDAAVLMDASSRFFNLIIDICRDADLAKKVYIIPSSAINAKKCNITTDKIMPGISSVAIAKHLDDTVKRTRRIRQRVYLLLKSIRGMQYLNQTNEPNEQRIKKWTRNIRLNMRRLFKQREALFESITNTIATCISVNEERRNHTAAIESSRNEKIFDIDNKYIDSIIATPGYEDHQQFIHGLKKDILGVENVKSLEKEQANSIPKYAKLQYLRDKWEKLLNAIIFNPSAATTKEMITTWYTQGQKANKLLNSMIGTVQELRNIEFKSAKNHFIRIGHYGPLARMTNPKPRSGPTANNSYPAKAGQPIHRAVNDNERMEASLQTHEMWMANPPGNKNCHFLDITSDAIGPNGITINPEKEFDTRAATVYLQGMLSDKVCEETATKIKQAHEKLPELFRQVNTKTKLTYPFKYDCVTGDYLHPDLERQLRKNVCQGNRKARATGFAIPVLGRLPKIFIDVYLLKCRIQMTLRLLDLGTESSLRICIGKPCGGIRPLTVGHDDNVFLNGIAQQAIQKEIAKHNILPENVCSYQKGKGCADATIVDCVVKEIALQNDEFYLAELVDDAEKMFDRLHLELQAVLLMLAGAGIQGFTEWQCANMVNRTNKLVTDIFVALLKYICGLPQGNGFSVEIANLYAMLLLMWWNMDPINPQGTIAPFTSPRHAFPLIAGGILKPVSSLAYVDDAKRFVAMLKSAHTCEEFFAVVQGYCDHLADLSLVIKMGRNVKKCTLFLFNIPHDIAIPDFTSIAWSYDAQGPVKGSIAVVVMQRDSAGHLLCYDVEKSLRTEMPENIQKILATSKYLGVASNAQLDNTDGKEKIINKMSQRIGLVSAKADSIQEQRITHNMLVCQVATFSPICISMSLKECSSIDKQLLTAYQYRMKCMPSDAKHSIFLSEKRGGIGVRSFTREYMGSLLRDIEVYISNDKSLPAHALVSSIEEATKQCMWNLHLDNKLPPNSDAAKRAAESKVSAKKTASFYEDATTPVTTVVSYDHTHIMEKAIHTTSSLGFMLRDLQDEFASRFVDELLLKDRYAKTIGSPLLSGRATLNACIGEGNGNFFKYSMLGRVYLLLQIILEQARKYTIAHNGELSTEAYESLLSRPHHYAQMNSFPREISAIVLATTARTSFAKFIKDYRIGCFINLVEWRSSTKALQNTGIQKPQPKDYKVIINVDNVFKPSLLQSMQLNSEQMSLHLKRILCLSVDDTVLETINDDPQADSLLLNTEILEYATQHDLPIFISIDGGLEQRVATVSITILAPDIKSDDVDLEWQDRPAKALLIRSWQLPQQWGTSTTCINMAESMGFLLGEYTIPPGLPIIYITDSNNARTLQRNIKNSANFTHRQMIRHVKQGIDSSIANHLEYLTSKWPKWDDLSGHTKEMYKRGEALCRAWATQKDAIEQKGNTNDVSIASSHSTNSDSSLTSSDASLSATPQKPAKNRYRFDETMLDCLERILIVKVFSHQLNNNYSIKVQGKQPSPNIFSATANQIADNAATQAKKLFQSYDMTEVDHCAYPPFSQRWSFSFEGNLTNKGATKVLHEKLDDEMVLRQQLREKQGLFLRMSPFNSLRAPQIGEESILRNLMKMTATCWTRSIYRYPPLANYVWSFWRHSTHNAHIIHTLPNKIPKNWKKNPDICDNIIKACPFCSSFIAADNKKGNLEHLHLYCPSKNLRRVREYCNRKIENALHELYTFNSLHEFNCLLHERNRTCTLQENLIVAAKEAELQERPTVQSSTIVYETRPTNVAIKSRGDIELCVLLHKLPQEKIDELDRFPLASQLGFIQAIPECDFNISTATITDVGFLGLFPKRIFQELRRYAKEVEQNTPTASSEFQALFDQLIAAFVYRPVTIQKIIHFLIGKHKEGIEKLAKRREAVTNPTHATTAQPSDCPAASLDTSLRDAPAQLKPRQPCHATKCRLLRARGTGIRQMYCLVGRNMCSGCSKESSKQCKVLQLEKEVLELSVENEILAPLLALKNHPTTIKHFRKLLLCLPSFAPKKSREDSIYGAARYLANTFGFLLDKTPSSNLLDTPMTAIEVRELWRQATFFCRCLSSHPIKVSSLRNFCATCSFLIPKDRLESPTKCPGCTLQDSWKDNGAPCLACQFANIAFRNSFSKRLTILCNTWLSLISDSDSSSGSDDSQISHSQHKSAAPPPSSQHTLKQLRQASYDESLDTIKTRSSLEENKIVFENLVMLRNAFTNNSTNKRDFDSTQSESILSIEATDFDANRPLRKKGRLSNKLLAEAPNCPSASDNDKASRPPLLPSDMATMTNASSSITRRIHQNAFAISSINKRNFDSTQSESTIFMEATDTNNLHRKKGRLMNKLPAEESIGSFASDNSKASRAPLLPLDINTMMNASSSPTSRTDSTMASSTRLKKQDRNLRMKARKAEQKQKYNI